MRVWEIRPNADNCAIADLTQDETAQWQNAQHGAAMRRVLILAACAQARDLGCRRVRVYSYLQTEIATYYSEPLRVRHPAPMADGARS